MNVVRDRCEQDDASTDNARGDQNLFERSTKTEYSEKEEEGNRHVSEDIDLKENRPLS